MNNYSIGAITYRIGHRYAQIKYFKKLAVLAKHYGVPFFIFCVDDVDIKNKQIRALHYMPVLKKWVRRSMHFPTVVYDHVRYHPTPQFRRYKKLRESGLMRFSYNGYAHKLIVIQYLSSFPEIAPYIPETELLAGVEDAIKFINSGATIIKPLNGTGGRDIFRVVKRENDYDVRGKDVPKENMLEHELKQWLHSLTNQERFLLQRMIPIQYDGRICDTRVLIQKNGDGNWSFTGMGTRIGRANAVASNLAKGASAIRTDDFIVTYLNKEPKPIMEEIEKVGLQIAERLEQKFGRFVEFGLDIGITPNGHFQLIEANSKPDRKIFIKTQQPEQFEQAIRKPLEYHIHLCKQVKEQK